MDTHSIFILGWEIDFNSFEVYNDGSELRNVNINGYNFKKVLVQEGDVKVYKVFLTLHVLEEINDEFDTSISLIYLNNKTKNIDELRNIALDLGADNADPRIYLMIDNY